MKLIKWGYSFDDADKVFVIRELDIKKEIIAKKILSLMEENKTDDPEQFFNASKICFLATKENFIAFLLSLQKILEEDKKPKSL